MTVNPSLLLSLLSLVLSATVGLFGIRRSRRTDDRADSAQLTTVIVKLENIALDVAEIKSDIRDVRNDVKNHAEKLIRLETQIQLLNKTVFGDNSE